MKISVSKKQLDCRSKLTNRGGCLRERSSRPAKKTAAELVLELRKFDFVRESNYLPNFSSACSNDALT